MDNLILLECPYEKDAQSPDNDQTNFLTSLFEKLCKLTLDREEFSKWKSEQKLVNMVPTIKETIQKEVVIEAKEDKKGKKDPNAQPQTEIVEETIEKKYESLP